MDLQSVTSTKRKMKSSKKSTKSTKSRKPRKSRKSKKVVEESASTPVVEESVSTPVVEESVSTPVVEESVSAPVVDESASTPVVDESASTPVVEDSVESFYAVLDNLNKSFDNVFSELESHNFTLESSKLIKKKYKMIQRNFGKFNEVVFEQYQSQYLDALKSVKKKRKRPGNKNSGLQKKYVVDSKLLKFMNLGSEELVSRVDVLRAISIC